MTMVVPSQATAAVLAGVLLAAPAAPTAAPSFLAFESGQVRPLALSADGSRLFALNTPDNRLEIFAVADDGLVLSGSVPVGLEPVAIAIRNDAEVWVVNHLSDSVSIVDVAASPARVVKTLLVGDEPRDIRFAGPVADRRAFIATARRGQHRDHASIAAAPGAGDPALTTPGVGRADVWVFDADATGAGPGGVPLAILSFFADTPRALAVSPDGNTVYVAAFHSGNRSTVIEEPTVCNGFQESGGFACPGGAPGGLPGPASNDGALPSGGGVTAPETGLIVQHDGSAWRDVIARDWSSFVPYSLPDQDVFAIDAATLTAGASYRHVGTTLFNMVINPVSGALYVTNTDAQNLTRFEGPGHFYRAWLDADPARSEPAGGTTVQGRLALSRITVIDPAQNTVAPRHLNSHIDYDKLHTDVPDLVDPAHKQHSLATPLQAVVSSDGQTLYVAAFGSARVGVFSTADLEDAGFSANFDPASASAGYLVTGGGPSGLALDEARGRLYVLERFANSVAVIDTGSGATLERHALHNPEPQDLVDGRPFLYDAMLTSGNGEASCASCHIFGDTDHLPWDLGDPDAPVFTNPQPNATFIPLQGTLHSMKGPMATQTLRGMATHGAMHWRGDRADGFFGVDPCNTAQAADDPSPSGCNENLSFNNFIVAFEGLVGRDGPISAADMQAFTDFALQLMMPPSPVRRLDNSETTAQADGRALYFGRPTDTVANCNGCHTLNPLLGFFGGGGQATFDATTQDLKVPQMRNLYSKVGMFGRSTGAAPLGDQIRGSGFNHDGSIGTIDGFLSNPVFTISAAERAVLEQFLLAMPGDLAPIVGQQVTLDAGNAAEVDPRIDLMLARAATPFDSFMLGGTVTECDVVVKGHVGGAPRGWTRDADGMFRDDTGALLGAAALRALAASEGPLTFTCAPPGSGERMGIDRDLDGVLDGLDNCAALVNAGQENFDADTLGDDCDADDDNDGLSDEEEVLYGTLRLNPDSDGDTVSDGAEVAAGTDPLDPASHPLIDQAVPLLPLPARALVALLLAGSVMRYYRRRDGGGAP